MIQEKLNSSIYCHRTRTAYLWSRILATPFWAIFNIFPFILSKDLEASALQITIIIALKPAASIFSPYWSAWIHKRRDRLLGNVIWGGILSYLPFFFFPFIDSPWFFVFASGFYMMLSRGCVPAWMEILKLNLSEGPRQKVFAYASAFGFVGASILPIAFGWMLDGYHQSWRWIFPLTALLALIPIVFQKKIPISYGDVIAVNDIQAMSTHSRLIDQIKEPWVNFWDILQRRPDFKRFLIGIILSGSGIMLWQPILPDFFWDILNLSYFELVFAFSLCKGVGYALTTPLWAHWMHRVNIFRFSSFVSFLTCLFPICLILAQWHIVWLYLAYILYGMMQAGSELCWNLSGPLFAKNEDSSVYSSVNVLAVGLRGSIVPLLGSGLFKYFNSTTVLIVGGALCFFATLRMLFYSQQHSTELKKPV